MDKDRIAPELRASMRRASPPGIEHRLGRRLISAALAIMPSDEVEGVALEKRPDVGRGVRVHRPSAVRSPAALLWMHGGGYVLGRAVLNDRLCSDIAREVGIVVVATEYRKAPGHPYPAALDDCLAAWAWLQEEATSLGIDPARVVIGGESAGGGLAASLAQRLHDDGGVQPIGQLLFCPMLDDRTAARRELDSVDHLVWNNRKNRFGWRSYLGAEPGGETVPPYAVPARRDDLAGLPSAWIGVSDIELFHDEAIAYAERLGAGGVPVELDVVADAPHGFESWAPDSALARQHTASAAGWLRRVLEGRQAPG